MKLEWSLSYLCQKSVGKTELFLRSDFASSQKLGDFVFDNGKHIEWVVCSLVEGTSVSKWQRRFEQANHLYTKGWARREHMGTVGICFHLFLSDALTQSNQWGKLRPPNRLLPHLIWKSSAVSDTKWTEESSGCWVGASWGLNEMGP